MDHSLFRLKGRDIVLLLTGAVLYSLGVHMFVTPANIAPGGTADVAILINYISGAPVGITTLLLNVPLLILSWVYLSRRFTIMTAFASTVCSLILDFAVFPVCPTYTGNRLLGGLSGGIFYDGDSGSMATIVTHSADQISRRIIRELDQSAIIMPGQGAYSRAQVDVVLCTVRKSQFAQLKRIVHETDSSAFVMVTETSSVFGYGFKSFEETI